MCSGGLQAGWSGLLSNRVVEGRGPAEREQCRVAAVSYRFVDARALHYRYIYVPSLPFLQCTLTSEVFEQARAHRTIGTGCRLKYLPNHPRNCYSCQRSLSKPARIGVIEWGLPIDWYRLLARFVHLYPSLVPIPMCISAESRRYEYPSICTYQQRAVFSFQKFLEKFNHWIMVQGAEGAQSRRPR